MHRLTVPRLGEGIVEVHILRLLKGQGEDVARDEPLYEVETAKATLVIESPCSGRVTQWLVEEGADAAVGQVIALVAGPTDDGDAGPEPADVPLLHPRVPPRTRARARAAGLTDPQILELARSETGTLLPEHIDRHTAELAQNADTSPDFTEVMVGPRALERAMADSLQTVVPALVATRLDGALLTRAVAALHRELSTPAFVTDFTVFAHLAARTAADHPDLRTRRLSGGRHRIFDRLQMGIAVVGESGDLTTAVVRDADTLGFQEFTGAYSTSVEQAREGSEQADGTVTLALSHVDSPVTHFAVPVVVAPAVATLFLGAPDPEGNRHLVLAFDHLVLDGLRAGRYLEDLLALIARTADTETSGPPPPPPSAARHESTDLVGQIGDIVRELLGSDIDPDLPLGQQGLTSQQAVALAHQLNAAHDTRLPVTAVWHHPTARALAAAVAGDIPPSATTDGPRNTNRTGAKQAIAIVGAACRLPGAENIEEFWELLCGEQNTFRDVPAERLPGFSPEALGIDPPKVRAGLLGRVDSFDAPFFRMSPRVAAATDPQQRMLLELSWHALEHATIAPSTLAGTRTAVFIGAGGYDYRELAAANGLADGSTATGTLQSYLANRISQFYGLHGPSITVDTACSSALTALTLAVDCLRAGSCDVALVGSAHTISNGFNATAYYRAGMLSPTGASTAFDDSCDGYVRGEGGTAFVLKSS